MPKPLRPIILALILAGAAIGVAGCGDNGGPAPSIAPDEAAVLTSKIDEIQRNVEVGSCLVAADKTNELIADIGNLPSSVNNDVRQALDSGANNLNLLVKDPSKCQGRASTTTSTTTPSTTESTTTTKTRPTTTTQTQTQTTPTQPQTTPTNPSGGVGPGSPGGL